MFPHYFLLALIGNLNYFYELFNQFLCKIFNGDVSNWLISWCFIYIKSFFTLQKKLAKAFYYIGTGNCCDAGRARQWIFVLRYSKYLEFLFFFRYEFSLSLMTIEKFHMEIGEINRKIRQKSELFYEILPQNSTWNFKHFLKLKIFKT